MKPKLKAPGYERLKLRVNCDDLLSKFALKINLRHYSEDAETYRIQDQFAIGDDLIVAPVVTRGAVTRDVYLTSGFWVDATVRPRRLCSPRHRMPFLL